MNETSNSESFESVALQEQKREWEIADFIPSEETRAQHRLEFIVDLALNVDAFRHSCIGYWGFGHHVKGNDKNAIWIVVETNDQSRDKLVRIAERAARLHRQGKPLPEGCHLLDFVAAERAYSFGERRWGERWYDDPQTDASRYDLVLQAALLGEIRYG